MFDFLFSPAVPANVWVVIILTGVVTYITRSSGHLVLARFKNLHPRLEAALEAVPGAVLITIVLPPALTNGPVEFLAMIAALAASFKLSPIGVLAVGMAIVVIGRALGF